MGSKRPFAAFCANEGNADKAAVYCGAKTA